MNARQELLLLAKMERRVGNKARAFYYEARAGYLGFQTRRGFLKKWALAVAVDCAIKAYSYADKEFHVFSAVECWELGNIMQMVPEKDAKYWPVSFCFLHEGIKKAERGDASPYMHGLLLCATGRLFVLYDQPGLGIVYARKALELETAIMTSGESGLREWSHVIERAGEILYDAGACEEGRDLQRKALRLMEEVSVFKQ